MGIEDITEGYFKTLENYFNEVREITKEVKLIKDKNEREIIAKKAIDSFGRSTKELKKN